MRQWFYVCLCFGFMTFQSEAGGQNHLGVTGTRCDQRAASTHMGEHEREQ